jgi:hypothetical protein
MNQFFESKLYDFWKVIIICINILLLFKVIYSIFFEPLAYVFHETKKVEAEFLRAESNRQITVLESLAKKESSKYLADAEIIRAQGLAEANRIIGQSLEGNEGYLRYLWIQGLQSNQTQIVYVPTEANLPILERTRLK